MLLGVLYGEGVHYRALTDAFGIFGIIFSVVYIVAVYQSDAGLFRLIPKPVTEKEDQLSEIEETGKNDGEEVNQRSSGLVVP